MSKIFNITYSKVAYVPCSKVAVAQITMEVDTVANGNDQAVVNFETFNDWINDDNNKNSELYPFFKEVRQQINTDNINITNDIGEIIFSC